MRGDVVVEKVVASGIELSPGTKEAYDVQKRAIISVMLCASFV